MTDLRPQKNLGKKHAGLMFLIGGMERVTKALHMGDGFEDVDGLLEVARRARAMADAIDARVAMEGGQ